MGFRHMNPASLATFNSSTSCNLLEEIDAGLTASIKSKDAEPKHRTFAPSSFRCARAMWFRLRGTQPDKKDSVDKQLDFFAHLGTSCHEYLQSTLIDQLKDNWIDVADYFENTDFSLDYDYCLEKSGHETLVEITRPYPIRFAVDGILRLDGTYYLLEIKTCMSDVFKDLTDPRPHHIDQVKCYSTILEIPNVLFVYIDRTYGDMKCYEYKVTSSDRTQVIDKFDSVMWSAEYNVAPDKLPSGDSWCSSAMCPYYRKCKDW